MDHPKRDGEALAAPLNKIMSVDEENLAEKLAALFKKITPADRAAAEYARKRWDGIAKPLGSLGLLEECIVRIAALTGSPEVVLKPRTLIVFCADNGVVRQGVAQCGPEVTASVAAALSEGRSTVSPMARLSHCAVLPVDVGIRDFPGHPGVLDRRIRNGTGDISEGPAMTREECLRAILLGASLAESLSSKGVRILAAGEMGIGNTTTGSAVASALLGMPPERLIGRGAGLSNAGLSRKKEMVQRAIQVNAPDPADPIDVLHKIGGLDIAAMCGVFLGGAAYQVPVLIDGMISEAAALCALRLCRYAKKAILASHVSREPSGRYLLDALGLKPLLTAEMALGEGSGAVAVLPLLDLALSVYHSGQTFARLGIPAYTRQ